MDYMTSLALFSLSSNFHAVDIVGWLPAAARVSLNLESPFSFIYLLLGWNPQPEHVEHPHCGLSSNLIN